VLVGSFRSPSQVSCDLCDPTQQGLVWIVVVQMVGILPSPSQMAITAKEGYERGIEVAAAVSPAGTWKKGNQEIGYLFDQQQSQPSGCPFGSVPGREQRTQRPPSRSLTRNQRSDCSSSSMFTKVFMASPCHSRWQRGIGNLDQRHQTDRLFGNYRVLWCDLLPVVAMIATAMTPLTQKNPQKRPLKSLNLNPPRGRSTHNPGRAVDILHRRC